MTTKTNKIRVSRNKAGDVYSLSWGGEDGDTIELDATKFFTYMRGELDNLYPARKLLPKYVPFMARCDQVLTDIEFMAAYHALK